MSVLHIDVAERSLHLSWGDETLDLGIGPTVLRDDIVSDPPAAEELTNAIGLVVDHLDDAVRLLPEVMDAAGVHVAGRLTAVIAAVEVGAPTELPFQLARPAAEDVFRTVATERRSDRAANPGLPEEALDDIVAWCCVVVGIMRRLHLDAITLAAPADGAPS